MVTESYKQAQVRRKNMHIVEENLPEVFESMDFMFDTFDMLDMVRPLKILESFSVALEKLMEKKGNIVFEMKK